MSQVRQRLLALDGIRGFAILLVMISHLDVLYIQKSAPRFIYQIITGSGVTGVTILFMLSAFLMTTVHGTQESLTDFMHKRYARIFPLFIAMCSVTMIVRVIPSLSWFVQIAVALLVLVATHLSLRFMTTRTAFFIFLGLQALISAIAAFAPYLNSSLFTWLVNVTIAFPFAKDVPMIDGVYWSLCTEILFYFIYPPVIRPFIEWLKKQPKLFIWLCMLSIIPVCGVINAIFQPVLNFSVIRLYLFAYFGAGIVAGQLYVHRYSWVERYQRIFIAPMGIVAVLLAISIFLYKTVFDDYFPSNDFPVLLMLWAVPFMGVLLASIDTTAGTMVTRFFQSKILHFFGFLSYSLYLTHAFVLNLVQHEVKAVDLTTNILIMIAIIAGSIVLAGIAHELVEKQYFLKRKVTTS